MKVTLLVCLLLKFFNVNGQKLPYNCGLLKNIVNRIELERQNIELSNIISSKILFADGKVIIKDEYKNDHVLDSILKLPDINTILSVHSDSLFYLTKNNVILDTFYFFSPACSYKINQKNVFVVNNYSDLKKYNGYNIITVLSLNSLSKYSRTEKHIVHYSAISFRHRSSKSKLDNVVFYYDVFENVPIVKEVSVMRKSDFDIDENSLR